MEKGEGRGQLCEWALVSIESRGPNPTLKPTTEQEYHQQEEKGK